MEVVKNSSCDDQGVEFAVADANVSVFKRPTYS